MSGENEHGQRKAVESTAQRSSTQSGTPSNSGSRKHGAPALLPDLSLPKGGGALRGIGEKFATNPATGTGSLSVPIATSPGRAGFELGLELSYDSGGGNGPFGIGWRLSTPSVARKTDKGLPRYADAEDSDVFVLSGAEDLVPVRVKDGPGTRLDAFDRGAYSVQCYRPRTEGLFARIERWTNRASGDAHWRAITRDNVLNIYGRSPDARIADPAALTLATAPVTPVALAIAGLGLVSGSAIPGAEWLLDWRDGKKTNQENGLHYLLQVQSSDTRNRCIDT